MSVNWATAWFALFAVLGIAVWVPILQEWVLPSLQQYPVHIQFLGSLAVPIVALLVPISWLEPG